MVTRALAGVGGGCVEGEARWGGGALPGQAQHWGGGSRAVVGLRQDFPQMWPTGRVTWMHQKPSSRSLAGFRDSHLRNFILHPCSVPDGTG